MIILRVTCFLLALAWINPVAQAQQVVDETYLFASAIEALAKKDTNTWVNEMIAWRYSFIGNYAKALQAYAKGGETASQESTPLPSDCQRLGAKAFIIEQSKKEQVLIINEAHHQPLHRVFTASLLPDLWAAGYRYLGLEALSDGRALMRRKKLLLEDGFYTVEPQFGHLIREALRLGFVLFSYEAENKNNIPREEKQADNIARFMRTHKRGKVLIHCGFSHIIEDKAPVWGKAMAGRLRTKTGINPFTINQVEFTERPDSAAESPLYRQLVGTEAAVFVRDGKPCKLTTDSSEIDLYLVHPRTQWARGRPLWAVHNSSEQYIDVQPHNKTKKYPCLVAAYRADESSQHVPVDVVELTSAADDRPLILPPGAYRLRIKTRRSTYTRPLMVTSSTKRSENHP
ncbi:hypothetical protein [Fibrella aquatilis]|uniref:Uncharacterized protein n=1 Tax=Fibrella aquatilis TaxID=2817059 RepID=A0A939GC07_9BACT|nr:hypothetical protein [Fibrella aquatilis]MBO0933618.1 hypothetical protein [Fibrella aquatilis]